MSLPINIGHSPSANSASTSSQQPQLHQDTSSSSPPTHMASTSSSSSSWDRLWAPFDRAHYFAPTSPSSSASSVGLSVGGSAPASDELGHGTRPLTFGQDRWSVHPHQQDLSSKPSLLSRLFTHESAEDVRIGSGEGGQRPLVKGRWGSFDPSRDPRLLGITH